MDCETKVIISLPELVDLALKTPEIGALNFNILHSLLQIIIQQIQLCECKVEFCGSEGARILKLIDICPCKVYCRTDEGQYPSGVCNELEEKAEEPESEGPVVVSFAQDPCKLSLYEELLMLKCEVRGLKELPLNPDLIDALRCGNGPLLEMYQVISLAKRVEASEENLSKLAAMLEEYIKQLAMNELNEARLKDLEDKLRIYIDHLELMDAAFRDQIAQLQCYIQDIEKELGELIESKGDDGQNYNDLLCMINQIQEELRKLAELVQCLKDAESQDEAVEIMDHVLEAIEMLKVTKADRQEVEDALSNKADVCEVNSKVAYCQFEATCKSLACAIDEMLMQIERQECMWKEALLEVQEEIEKKVDKCEFMPFSDYVHCKLKKILEMLKETSKAEAEEAAGRHKFLRNLQCVACDNKAIMRKEYDPSAFPPPIPTSPVRGIGPQIAYELDQIRSRRKISAYGRKPHREEDREQAHPCLRYCGGSHTKTTPKQRVPKLGDFKEQWDLDFEPQQDKDIVGTDGNIYKSTEPAASGCYDYDCTCSQESVKPNPAPLEVKSELLSSRANVKLEPIDKTRKPDKKAA